MKKIIMVVIAVMLFVSMTSYAGDTADIFPIMKSGSVRSDITLECESSDLFAGLAMVPFIDSEYFLNGLSNVELKCDENYDINDDYTKINFSATIDVDFPLNFNSYLQIGTKMKIGMWLEYDVTDDAAPICRIVFVSPVDRRYVVIDVVEELRYRGYDINKLSADFKKYINKENIEGYIEKINEILVSNATVIKGRNKQTLTLSGEQYKNFLKDFIEYFSEVLFEYKGLFEDSDMNIDVMAGMPDGVDMSMVIEIRYDSKGNIADVDEEISISFDEETAEMAGIKSFSFGGKSIYNNVNGPVSIDFPKLTEENSVMYYGLQNYYGDCTWISVNCDYIPASDETFYVPLFEIMTALRDCGHKYTVENRGGNVVITNIDDSEAFDTLEFTVGSSEFMVDSEKFIGVNPVLYSNGTLFVDNKLLESVFGFTYYDATTELISGKTEVCFERFCPPYEYEEGVIEENYYDYQDDFSYEDTGEEYEYCGHFENLWMSVDYPGFDNDYFGLRALLENHTFANGYDGQYDIAYDNGVVTIINNGAKDYFNTATITVGSNIIIVDGSEYETALPAVNRDGKVYVDKDAIDLIMKYELKGLNIVYPTEETEFTRSAGFERIVPGCTHDYEDIKWYSSFYY